MRTLGLVLVAAVLGLAPRAATAADDLGPEARRRFLETRDAQALLAAFPADRAVSGPWLDLARMAAGRAPASLKPDATGLDALPAVVLSLRELALADADAAARRADSGGGVPAAWATALVLLRRGDDAGAVGRLLAPPLFAWDQDAFPLALLAAALHPDDRRMLERAAARLRIAAIVATAQAAVAVDPRSAARALVLAVRALRRGLRLDAAEDLLRFAHATGVDLRTPELALEAGLTAWARRAPEEVPPLLAGPAPAGAQGVFLALRRAGRCPRPPTETQPWRHAPGPLATADLAGRLATAVGVPTSPGEIESWARRVGRDLAGDGALRAALEARGLTVLEAAGDPAAGDAALAAGLPFVLRTLVRTPQGYRDLPALVTGYDRCTGLWLLQQPDMRRVDVAVRAAAVKGRLLVAAPPARADALAAVRRAPGLEAGERIAAAYDEVERGAVQAPERLLSGGDVGVVLLHRAALLRRLAERGGSAALAEAAAQAAEASRRTPPLVGLEAFLRGEARARSADPRGAIADFDQAERLEGVTVGLLLARLAAELAGERPDDALATLERAAAHDPLDVRVLFHRGTTRAALRDRWAGRADLKRALDRRPTAVGVAVALAQLELRGGKPAAALDILRDTMRRDSHLEEEPALLAARRAAELELIRSARSVEALRPLRRSPEVETRRRLAFALAERSAEGDEAESLLRKLLGDPDEGVRATTLRLYQRSWLRRRVEEDTVLCRRVIQVLREDAAADVRKVAAVVLGRTQSPVALRALAAVVAGDAAAADASVRAAAARALGLHAETEDQAALVEALGDADVDVRRAAIDSLFQRNATRLGFDPQASPEARAEAIAAWRARLAGR